jgi:hypothetical protein
MKDDMAWKRLKWMRNQLNTGIWMSISFSVFGMLLIFGLGFVFPTINPYVVIKWIIIVTAVVFALSLIKYVIYMVTKWRMKMTGGWKAKKTSKK